ncbi:hypothetical protein K438DRAFT_2001228 [Mycena galopus ATCC 62051]|nr:hypothetical protein K438DRAFT_2001228 [Mycena galopus ATCC 62051]
MSAHPDFETTLLDAPTGDASLSASPTARTDRTYVVRWDLFLSSPIESDYDWLHATTLFDTIAVAVRSVIIFRVDPYVLANPFAFATSTRSSPRRRAARHLVTRLATSTRGSSCRSQARHLDARLGTSTPGSAPRRGAHHLDLGLATSMRGSPYRLAPFHLDTGLPTSTCHVVTRLATWRAPHSRIPM